MDTEADWSAIPRGGGSFVKFDRPGVKVVGRVTARRLGTDFNGQPCPELDVETDGGDTLTVTGGQANLKAQLLDLNPGVDDRISIEFTHTEKAEKGDRKMFDVKVKAAAERAPAVDLDAF